MDYTIKELPQEERPREKIEERGPGALTDVELLSIVLRTGTTGKNVKELSAEVLNSYSLSSIADRPIDELKDFEGISRVKAGQLLAVSELARRMKNEEREKLESLSDVEARVQDMKFLEKEKLRVFHLDSGNELIAEEEVEGGVGSVRVEPSEIVRSAVRKNASAMVIAHNHPSGEHRPTEQDLEFTRELIDLCGKMGLKLLDHVIVGDRIGSARRDTELRF